MQYYGISDKGIIRKNNQDCFTVKSCESRSCIIAVLCDGMGGAQAGGIASELANREFTDYVYSRLTSRTNKNPDLKSVLLTACAKANSEAYDYSLFDISLNGMGTTIVGGIIKDNGEVKLINVGDSRAYHFSASEGTVQQITTDHSLVEDLVSSGVLSREQARVHKQKNIITRAIGTEDTVTADYFETVLAYGDMLLLCSDGLSNYVSDAEMLAAFQENSEPESFCSRMLSLTYEKGAGDNVTLVSVVNI